MPVATVHIEERSIVILLSLCVTGLGAIVLGMIHPAISPHTAAAVGILIPLAWIDFRYGVVSDLILLVGVGIAVLLGATIGAPSGTPGLEVLIIRTPSLHGFQGPAVVFLLPGAIAAFLAWFVRMVGQVLARAPGMGMGDVKLMFVLGLLLGLEACLIFYMGICAAGLYAAGGMIAGRLTRGGKVPFVPFLLVATLAYPAVISRAPQWLF